VLAEVQLDAGSVLWISTTVWSRLDDAGDE
jgi:hypothetical protein